MSKPIWDRFLFAFDGVIAGTEPLHRRCCAGVLQSARAALANASAAAQAMRQALNGLG